MTQFRSKRRGLMKNILVFFIIGLSMFIGINSAHSTINYRIGIFYVVTSGQTLNSDWGTIVDRGMNLVLPRLNQFFASYGYSWSYQKLSVININYLITPNLYENLPSGLDKTVTLISQAYPNFISEYQSYNLIIILFAGNFEGAYSYDFKGPIYASQGLFLAEAINEPIIEHEVLHIFGLPDHNSPHSKPIYDNCLMGNLYMNNIVLCSECLITFNPSIFGKSTLEELGLMLQLPPPPTPIPPIPGGEGPSEGGGWLIPIVYRDQFIFVGLIAVIMFFILKKRN